MTKLLIKIVERFTKSTVFLFRPHDWKETQGGEFCAKCGIMSPVTLSCPETRDWKLEKAFLAIKE